MKHTKIRRLLIFNTYAVSTGMLAMTRERSLTPDDWDKIRDTATLSMEQYADQFRNQPLPAAPESKDEYYPGSDYQRLFNAINDVTPNPILDQMDFIIKIVREDFPLPAAPEQGQRVWVEVPVSENRYPADGEDTICFASKRGLSGVNGYKVIAWREKDRWSTEKYHNFNDNQDMHVITHWLELQTLPALPVQQNSDAVEKFTALNTLVTKFGRLAAHGEDCDEYERLYNIWKPGTFPNENPSTNS